MRNLEGVVQLPRAEFVAEDALGQTFLGRVEIATFELTYPRLPHTVPDGEVYWLDPPDPVEEFVSDTIRHGVGHWGYASNMKRLPDGKQQAVAWQVDHLAIGITDNEADEAVALEIARIGAACRDVKQA